MEKLVSVARIYDSGRNGSLIVVIPAEVRNLLGVKKGEKFAVKLDARGRIIYERIQKRRSKSLDATRSSSEDNSRRARS